MRGALGHETLCVSDAGLLLLNDTLQRNRAHRDAHEALVERAVREMTQAGLDVVRPAPRRAAQMPFAVWMALARATPLEGWRFDAAPAHLGDTRGFLHPPDR